MSQVTDLEERIEELEEELEDVRQELDHANDEVETLQDEVDGFEQREQDAYEDGFNKALEKIKDFAEESEL